MGFNSFSLYIIGTNAGEFFFFFQNTVNAETLYVYRMLESILEKNVSINSIVDIATFFYMYQ